MAIFMFGVAAGQLVYGPDVNQLPLAIIFLVIPILSFLLQRFYAKS